MAAGSSTSWSRSVAESDTEPVEELTGSSGRASPRGRQLRTLDRGAATVREPLAEALERFHRGAEHPADAERLQLDPAQPTLRPPVEGRRMGPPPTPPRGEMLA